LKIEGLKVRGLEGLRGRRGVEEGKRGRGEF